MGAIKALNQTDDLEAYNDAFDLLLNKVDIPEAHAVSLYIEGLKPEIKCYVRLFNPKLLREAHSLARLQNNANVTVANHKPAPMYRPAAKPYFSPAIGSSSKLPLLPAPPLKANPINSYKPTATKRLTSKEFDEKRARGECFWCSERFTPGHKCTKTKQLYLFEIDDAGDELVHSDPNEYYAETAEDTSQDPLISLNAITGIPSYSTMKVVGAIGTRPLHILIDSGSTHNFLNDKLAAKLNCTLQTIKDVPVTIADGNKLSCVQSCKDFQWIMQGSWFKADMLVIPLRNYDVVLGIQWLQTLNDIVWNFKSLTMRFTVENQSFELRGTDSKGVSMCSMSKLSSLLQSDQVVQAQLFSLHTTSEQSFQHEPVISNNKVMQDMNSLLENFSDVFVIPEGLPPKRACDHRIKLKNEHINLNLKPYRYPSAQKTIIEQMTQELLDSGVIKNSTSAFAAPVVLVKKKDGSWRMCVDYRRLNEATIKDGFPIPLIEELLDELGGASVFSKLDLRSGYHQVRMHETDIHKTAFKTHQGHYEFLVLPFGLTNAPATFQSLMNEVFKSVLRKTTLVFFDDILVYSKSWDQHLLDLAEVLSLMRLHSLKAKHSKCTFGGDRVEYLGHIITGAGVSTDPQKIQAVRDWPTPVNVKQLRGFLGLAGYYRRFIKGFGTIAKPMTDLLRKDAFSWQEPAQIAFETLKAALSTAPVLALPDMTKVFVIETDASAKGLGAVLMQDNHPIAFISKALSIRQQALSVYEKELLAIIMAVKQWHHLLIIKHFIIKTDQQSLKHLLDQKVVTPLQQTWLSKLLGYDYEICYKKGCDNVVADALSRVSGLALFTLAVNSLQPALLEKIQHSWLLDSKLQALIAQLSAGQTVKNKSWDGSILRRKGKLVVGPDASLRSDIIHLCHSSAVGGHSGFKATLVKLKDWFYWKGCSKEVHRVIKECVVCQRVKYETVAYPGLLQPLPIPKSFFSDISMDFISGLPKVQGKNTILVIVDRLTKYGHFIPLSHPYTAAHIAQLFLDHIFTLHGNPSTIVSDRDPLFMSHFWKEFMKLQGVKLTFSSAYHPQIDGQTEVLNRCLESYLRCMVLDTPLLWLKWLPLAQWWYNTSLHSSIKMSPHEALYGIKPPIHIPYIPHDSSVAAVEDLHRDREVMIQLLKTNLATARNRMVQMANANRSERNFQVGEWVYVKLQPGIQSSLKLHRHPKLAPRYYGPFLILEKFGNTAYKVDLPPESSIHPTFHVSLLKAAHGSHAVIVPLPDTPRFTCYPRAILDRKMVKRGSKAVMQVLVHWVGLDVTDATWEFLPDIQLRFPDFQF